MRIRVGLGSCGIAAGGNKVLEEIKKQLKDKNFTLDVETTGCIGVCFLEPLVDVIEDDYIYTYGKVTPEKVKDIVESHIINGKPVEDLLVYTSKNRLPAMDKQVRIALRNCGVINPESIDDYLGRKGYQGIKRAVTSMTQKEVIEIKKTSGLRGRGGAGFPPGSSGTPPGRPREVPSM